MPWLIIVLGYFWGSIPTAYIVSRLVRGVDIRQLGDANMGAANVYRELGAKVGIIVFCIDVGKGAIAVFIAQSANVHQLAVLATGFAAVIGHNWPVFIGFRGGRGVSATIGVFLIVITQPMLIMAGPTIIALLVTRKVIFSNALLFISLPLVCWLMGIPGLHVGYSITLPCLIGFTHYIRTRQQVARQA